MKRIRPLTLFVVATAWAAFIRLPTLTQGLWEDECTSVFIASAPTLRELLRRQIAIDFSPPLFNAVLDGWGRLFSFGEISVKLLAILLGSLAVGAIAIAAAEMFGTPAGAFAALLASANGLLADMSAEVRPYSLSALLTALCLWSLFRMRRRAREDRMSFRDISLFAIVAVLAALSHYAATVAVAIIGLVSIAGCAFRKERAFWCRALAATLVAGLAFAPWLPVALRQARVGLPWAIRLNPHSRMNVLIYKVMVLFPAPPDRTGMMATAGLALTAAGLLATFAGIRRAAKERWAELLLPAATGAAAFVIVGRHGVVARYVTVPAAMAAIVMAGLLAVVVRGCVKHGGIERRFAFVGAALLAFAALLQGLTERRTNVSQQRAAASKSGVRTFCREGRLLAGDLVIAAPDSLAPTLWYYAPPGPVLRGFVHWSDPVWVDFADYPRLWPDPAIVERTIEKARAEAAQAGSRQIVLITGRSASNNPLPFWKRDEELRKALENLYRPIFSADYDGLTERVRVEIFDLRRAAEPRN